MKKRLLSLFLLGCIALGSFTGCDLSALLGGSSQEEISVSSSVDSAPEFKAVDYAGETILDFDADSQTVEVEKVKSYIDGDTTHFYLPDGVIEESFLKARYMGVNTPESTGKIEKWGKKASDFTRSKLEGAESIVLESNGSDWEVDSTGERYLVWVWYKTKGADSYRNLNLELLQEGLAGGSGTSDCRYSTECTKAIYQATVLKLHKYSDDVDPDFYESKEYPTIDLKEFRLNIDDYINKPIAFNGYISFYSSNGIYVEKYDAESDMYFGIYVYVGYDYASDTKLQSILTVGNYVRIAGKCTYSENWGYQVSDVKYRRMKPDDPANVQLLEVPAEDVGRYPAYNTPITAEKLNSTVQLEVDEEKKTFKYSDVTLGTSLSIANLTVTKIYTTESDTKSDGAMTLTCKTSNGITVKVRTIALEENGVLVTADRYQNKNITVRGILDHYNGEYQIKVLSVNDILINE